MERRVPTEQARLEAAGQALAQVATSLSDAFARELARVLRLAERALLPILTDAKAGKRTARSIAGKALPLRTELRAVLTKAGYDRLVSHASIEAVAQMADALRASGNLPTGSALGRISPSRLTALAQLLDTDLMGVGDQAAHALWRASVQAIYTERPASAVIGELARTLEKSFAQAHTLFDTQVSIVGRQIVWLASVQDEQQAYLYVGPVDSQTREWCLAQVGMVRSQPAIETLDNGQLPNPFLTAGGYNCRHSWLAVSDPALVALKDSGQRADGYEARVTMARTLKAQRKRFRELRRAA